MGTFLAIILITSAKFLRANGNNAPLFRTNCYFEICAWPRSHLACLPGLWMIARRKEEGAGWRGFAQFRLSQRTVYGTGGHCFMIAPAAGNTYQDGQLQNTYQENPIGEKEIHKTVPWRRTPTKKNPSKVMPQGPTKSNTLHLPRKHQYTETSTEAEAMTCKTITTNFNDKH